MSGLLHDFRYSLRQLRKLPGFTIVAVVTLALGIGANSVVFSALNALFLRELAVPKAERLVTIAPAAFSYPDYLTYRDQATVFESLAASFQFPASSNLNSSHPPEHLFGVLVTGNLFTTLGVRPIIGRAFLPEEDTLAAPKPVVVLSYGLWQRRFSGDPGVAGRTIRLNNANYTVVGVVGKEFTGIDFGLTPDYWLPMAMLPQMLPGETAAHLLTDRGEQGFELLGRLKPGIMRDQALAQVNAIHDRLRRAAGESGRQSLSFEAPGQVPGGMGFAALGSILMVIAGLVLLVACVNLSNLLLARAAARRKDVAVRMALGSGRWRVVRQLMVESLLLSFLGAGAAFVLSLWVARVLSHVNIPLPVPVVLDFTPDLRVLAATAGIAILTSLLFGLAPALSAARTEVNAFLKESGVFRRAMGHRFRNFLVGAQVALCIVVLSTAGLFVRSLEKASSTDLGFRPQDVLVMRMDPVAQGYSNEGSMLFFRRLEEQVSALPGGRSASVVAPLPLSIFNSPRRFALSGTTRSVIANVHVVGARYFEVMGIPLLKGPGFRTVPFSSPPVAVISQSTARNLFPGEDPLGRSIQGGFGSERTSYEIVGVAGDTKSATIGEQLQPVVYELMGQDSRELANFSSFGGISLVVKTFGDPRAFVPDALREVARVDPGMPVYGVETMEEQVGNGLVVSRVCAVFLGAFGGLGLALAAVGLYGVMSYAVASRTREIAIRMALGTSAGRMLATLSLQGLRAVGIGVALGWVASVLIGRLVATLLYGVSGTDPLAIGGAPILLVVVAAIAVLLPAWRVVRLDPMVALRYE
jgi:predicted permease